MRTTSVWRVVKVIPMEITIKRMKERLDFLGQSDDLKYSGNLFSILVMANLSIEKIAVVC
jgi:hypothetical protein